MYLDRVSVQSPTHSQPTEKHVRKCEEFIAGYHKEANAATKDSTARTALVKRLLDYIAYTLNLRLAWHHVATYGGKAPGPDGLRCSVFFDFEVWGRLRALRDSILDDTYQPGECHSVKIRKRSGNGTRTLMLLDLFDRVVQRAAVQILQPLLDQEFFAFSLGFRPGQGREQALARAEALAVRQGRWCWVVEDLRDAFDRVPLRRLMEVVKKYLPDDRLMRLIKRIVLTVKPHGLRQGGSLSPLLLNVFLHHMLDSWWKSELPGVPLIRVADDILVLCTSHDEARRVYERLTVRLKSIGMAAKNGWDAAVHNLQGSAHADWLGFRLRRGEKGLIVEVADRSWSALEQHLVECHAHPLSPFRAQDVIRGWVGQLGAAYAHVDRDQVYARIVKAARAAAFEEVPTSTVIMTSWLESSERWRQIRDETTRNLENLRPGR